MSKNWNGGQVPGNGETKSEFQFNFFSVLNFNFVRKCKNSSVSHITNVRLPLAAPGVGGGLPFNMRLIRVFSSLSNHIQVFWLRGTGGEITPFGKIDISCA